MKSGSLRDAEADEFEQALEVVIAVVFDLDAAFFCRVLDGDVGGEMLAEAVGDGADLDVHFTGSCGFFRVFGFVRRSIEEGLREFLGGADCELAPDDLIEAERG